MILKVFKNLSFALDVIRVVGWAALVPLFGRLDAQIGLVFTSGEFCFSC
jgi:hypothetical protein